MKPKQWDGGFLWCEGCQSYHRPENPTRKKRLVDLETLDSKLNILFAVVFVAENRTLSDEELKTVCEKYFAIRGRERATMEEFFKACDPALVQTKLDEMVEAISDSRCCP